MKKLYNLHSTWKEEADLESNEEDIIILSHAFNLICLNSNFSLLLPFLEVMLQTLAKYLKDRDYENSNKVEPVDNFPEEVKDIMEP